MRPWRRFQQVAPLLPRHSRRLLRLGWVGVRVRVRVRVRARVRVRVRVKVRVS